MGLLKEWQVPQSKNGSKQDKQSMKMVIATATHIQEDLEKSGEVEGLATNKWSQDLTMSYATKT